MGTTWSYHIFVLSALTCRLSEDFKMAHKIYVSSFPWRDISTLIVSPSIGENVLTYILKKKYNLICFDEAKQGVQIFFKLSSILAPSNGSGFFFNSTQQLEKLLALFSTDSYTINKISQITLKSKNLQTFLDFLASCIRFSFKN